MKCIILFSICALLISFSFDQPIDPYKYSSPIKVACIDNSITYGSGIDNRPLNSYPAQLQRMLGNNWIVRNFGIVGRTMLKKGDYPFWKEEAHTQAKNFLPDVIVIKLGTNDTKTRNWKFSNEFYSDYKAIVRELKALSSHTQIFVRKPVPVYSAQWRTNHSFIVHGVIPTIERLGKEEKLQVIDLYTPLSGKPKNFPDHIYPNAEGTGLMAKTIYKALTGDEGTLVQLQYRAKQQPIFKNLPSGGLMDRQFYRELISGTVWTG
jgi:lysophospholipase L1-like esterase